MVRKFSWVILRTPLAWSKVQESLQHIPHPKSNFDCTKNSRMVFEQYGRIKIYCSDEKLAEWKEKKLSTEDRWVEIFQNMDTQQVSYAEFARLIEYILCLPGTSAAVERVFSLIKNVWKTESARLDMSTLKAILLVKKNLDYSCVEFYQFLRAQPALLRKIVSQDKYSFKEPTLAASVGPSKMSIESQRDDESNSSEAAGGNLEMTF